MLIVTQSNDASEGLRAANSLDATRVFALRGTSSTVDDIDVIGVDCPLRWANDELWAKAERAAKLVLAPLQGSRNAVREDWLQCAHFSLATEFFLPLLLGLHEASVVSAAIDDESAETHVLIRNDTRGIGFRLGLEQIRGGAATFAPAVASTTAPRPGRKLPPRVRYDVIFAEMFAYRLAKLTPLIDLLRAEGRTVAILGLTSEAPERAALQTFAGQHDLPIHQWTEWLGAGAMISARHAVGLMTQRWWRVGAAIGQAAGALGFRSSDAALSAIHKGVRKGIVRSFGLGGVFEAALAMQPKVIFTSRGDGSTLRSLSYACAAHDCVVVDVQHGSHGSLTPGMVNGIRDVEWALASVHTSRSYSANGITEDKLHLVGSLGFDSVMRDARGVEREDAPLIVYSSSYADLYASWAPDGTHVPLLQALNTFLEAHTTARVMVVPHPKEGGPLTRDTVAKLSCCERFEVARPPSNGALFRRAAAHVSVSSTTSLEAALVGTPAFMVDRAQSPYFDDAVAMGAITRLNSANDLPSALAAALGRETSPSEVIAAYAISDDCRTAERVLKIPSVARALRR